MEPTNGTCVVVPKKAVNTYVLDEARRAVTLAREADVPNVVTYESVTASPMYVALRTDAKYSIHSSDPKMELCPLHAPLSEEDAIGVIRQLAQIIFTLHRKRIVHGLLRAEVLRETADGKLYLLETGIPPTFFTRTSASYKKIMRLAAPELRAGGSYGFASDVWGLGAVFLELVSQKGATMDSDDFVDTGIVSPVFGNCSPLAVSFLVQTLKKEPGERPTLEDLAQHPIISGAGSDGHGFTNEVSYPAEHVDPENNNKGMGAGSDVEEEDSDDASSDEEEEEEEEEDEDDDDDEEESESDSS